MPTHREVQLYECISILVNILGHGILTVFKDLTSGDLLTVGAGKEHTLDISPLAVDLLNVKDLADQTVNLGTFHQSQTPYLFSYPGLSTLGGITVSDGVDNPMLHRMRRPPLLQEIVLKVRSLGASRLGHNVSKQFVRHLALFPIKRTSFRRATKAAGEFLVVDECLDSVLLGLVVEVDV